MNSPNSNITLPAIGFSSQSEKSNERFLSRNSHRNESMQQDNTSIKTKNNNISDLNHNLLVINKLASKDAFDTTKDIEILRLTRLLEETNVKFNQILIEKYNQENSHQVDNLVESRIVDADTDAIIDKTQSLMNIISNIKQLLNRYRQNLSNSRSSILDEIKNYNEDFVDFQETLLSRIHFYQESQTLKLQVENFNYEKTKHLLSIEAIKSQSLEEQMISLKSQHKSEVETMKLRIQELISKVIQQQQQQQISENDMNSAIVVDKGSNETNDSMEDLSKLREELIHYVNKYETRGLQIQSTKQLINSLEDKHNQEINALNSLSHVKDLNRVATIRQLTIERDKLLSEFQSTRYVCILVNVHITTILTNDLEKLLIFYHFH